MTPEDLKIGQVYYRYKPPALIDTTIRAPVGMRFRRQQGDAFLFNDKNGHPVMAASSDDLCYYYDSLEIALIHYYRDRCKKSINQMHYHQKKVKEEEKEMEVTSEHLRVLSEKYPEEFV